MQQKQNNSKYVEEKLNSATETFDLSLEEVKAIEQEKLYYEDARSVLITALKIVQKNHGWVPDGAIVAIAKVLNISDSDVEGVATFYSQIFRQPVGRHIIRYCDSMVCFIMGYQKIQTTLERILDIKSGETTSDSCFTLLPTCCLGNCDKGPIIMIDDTTYVDLTPEIISQILEKYR